MSWAFITAMRKNPQQSYVQLLNSIRDELATKYTQKPQLSCSHPLSTCFLSFPLVRFGEIGVHGCEGKWLTGGVDTDLLFVM
jgi:hypothetical protein